MTSSLASAKEVRAALAALGLAQPDPNALQAIQRTCREAFLEHLSACVASTDNDGAHRKAVEGLLTSLAAETCQAITALGLIPSYDAIARAGHRAPTRFLSAIPIASDPGHPRHGEAKAYLESILAPPPAPPTPADQAPAPSAADPGRQAAGTPPPLPAGEPAEPAIRPKAYLSHHVYGAGFALCFNAGEWNGAQGVMVDAAVADGARAYDWRNAVHVWLDAREVAAVLAVFRKRRPAVEFTAHGAQNDKSFSLAFQRTHFYAKVAAKDKGVRAVKMLPTDATAVSVLFLRQLGMAYPDVPLNTLLELAMSVNEVDAMATSAA